MWKAFRQWLETRRAEKEAALRLKSVAVRAKVFANTEEKPSATGIFAQVKKELEDATDEKRKAREAARRIISSTEDKDPL